MRRLVVLFLSISSVIGTSAQIGVLRMPRARTPVVYTAPDIAVDDPTPEFPLHVQIVNVRFGGATDEYHGYGTGNILEGSTPRGFDYTFQCEVPFTANVVEGQSYKARWRKESYRLELLMARAGSDHEDKCTLAIALKPTTVDPTQTSLPSHGTSRRRIPLYDAPDVAFTGDDPDYPARLHVLSTDREHFNPLAGGSGTANLLDSGPTNQAQGVTFAYACYPGFLPNSQLTEFYRGRWLDHDRLEILLQRTGSGKIDRCLLKTTVDAQAFPQRPH